MKHNVTPQTQAKAHALAKEVYHRMVEGYLFDGRVMTPLPAVTIDHTIISHIADSDELLRLKLTYGKSGPDDYWKASAEALLGGGIDHKGKEYQVAGASSSLKEGNIWMATDNLRRRLHSYFGSAQEALSYLGVFFSGCHHGIQRLDDLHGTIVPDGESGSADGKGQGDGGNGATLQSLGGFDPGETP